MKYICSQDIENLAAQGKKELVLDGDTVLMELARDMARMLGIAIVDGHYSNTGSSPSRPIPAPAPAGTAPALAPSTFNSTPASGSKPRGCQHA